MAIRYSKSLSRALLGCLLASLAVQCGGGSLPPGPFQGNCPELNGRPTSDDYYCELRKMVGFGPRLTGSPGHKDFLDHIQTTLQESGFTVSNDVMNFPRWKTERTSLVLHTAKGDEEVTVAYPFVRSKFTGDEGLRLPLAYADNPNLSNQERIVLGYAQFTTDEGFAGCQLRFQDMAAAPASKPVVFADVDANVKGLICCVDQPLDRIQDDYQDFESTMVGRDTKDNWENSIPTLILDQNSCTAVAAAIDDEEDATLTLTGTYNEDTTRHIWGTLPGREPDKYILLGTHTDGQNAVEENGIASKLVMAKYFGDLADAGVEFQYSLLFVGVTGHMSAYDVPYAGTWGFCNSHLELMSKVEAAINFEHLGVPEKDSSGAYGYYTTRESGAELYEGTAIMESSDHLPVTISHGLTPPMAGSAVGFRPPYCGERQIGKDINTFAGVIYPWYYLNLEYGGIDKIDKRYLYQQSDTILSITEKLLDGQG